MGMTPVVAKLEVGTAKDLATFFNVPQTLIDYFFCTFNGRLYPMIPFLLHVGHKKGIQNIQIVKLKEGPDEWISEARIYPKISEEMLKMILALPADERKQVWDYFSRPVIEWGRASKQNVRAEPMQMWIPEMSIKRAAARGLKLFSGVFITAYEELPDAVIDEGELRETRPMTVQSKPEQQSTTECVCGHGVRNHVADRDYVYCLNCAEEKKDVKCSLTLQQLKALQK